MKRHYLWNGYIPNWYLLMSSLFLFALATFLTEDWKIFSLNALALLSYGYCLSFSEKRRRS